MIANAIIPFPLLLYIKRLKKLSVFYNASNPIITKTKNNA